MQKVTSNSVPDILPKLYVTFLQEKNCTKRLNNRVTPIRYSVNGKAHSFFLCITIIPSLIENTIRLINVVEIVLVFFASKKVQIGNLQHKDKRKHSAFKGVCNGESITWKLLQKWHRL